MKRVWIYGSSDDLIEIDGDIRDEFGASDSVAFSDGTLINIEYSPEGYFAQWRLEYIKGTGNSRIEHHASLGDETQQRREVPLQNTASYSDVIVVEGDFDWVVVGHKAF